MSIREFLGLDKKEHAPTIARKPATAETETVRKIVGALDQMEPDRARYIAAFAFILCRVAEADMNITQAEIDEMEQIIMEKSRLPEEQAILVVQMAKTQSHLFGGTENFLVTREFNRIARREQKLTLLDCLFAVAAVDMISTTEENEIREIGTELELTHDDFVAGLIAYGKYRLVKQKPQEAKSPQT
jgi:uncharacterized tellurite resistance protein B-like protein